MIKILLLEDDSLLSESLELFLEREGYEIDIASTQEEAERLSYENSYSIYLFDINLTDGNGLELLAALRHAEDYTPTIFITALHDMDSLAKGFDLGALDYIKKPFNPQELLIRLNAKFKNSVIRYKNIEYEESTGILRKDGKLIQIGNTQFKIFIKLLLNLGSVVDKTELYEVLEHPSDNSLRVALSKIKQCLEIEITNIRGRGYLLEKI